MQRWMLIKDINLIKWFSFPTPNFCNSRSLDGLRDFPASVRIQDVPQNCKRKEHKHFLISRMYVCILVEQKSLRNKICRDMLKKFTEQRRIEKKKRKTKK